MGTKYARAEDFNSADFLHVTPCNLVEKCQYMGRLLLPPYVVYKSVYLKWSLRSVDIFIIILHDITYQKTVILTVTSNCTEAVFSIDYIGVTVLQTEE